MATMQATSVTYKGLPQNDWEKYSKGSPMSPQAAQKASRRLNAFMMILLVVFGFSAALFIPLLLTKSEVLDFPLESSQAPLPFAETEPKPSLFDDYYYNYEDYKPSHNDKEPKDKESKDKKGPNKKLGGITTNKMGPKFVITAKVTAHNGSAVTKSPSRVTTKTTLIPKNGTSLGKKTTASKISKISRMTKGRVTPTKASQHPSTPPHNHRKAHRSSSTAVPQKPTATSTTATSEVTNGLSENSNSTGIVSKIINAIYNRNQNDTSGSISDEEIRKWINDLIANQPNVVVAVLGTAAVFLGLILLMASIICVRQRRKTANRRLKIQDVVTDLQASDKVVLLTSDLSDDE